MMASLMAGGIDGSTWLGGVGGSLARLISVAIMDSA